MSYSPSIDEQSYSMLRITNPDASSSLDQYPEGRAGDFDLSCDEAGTVPEELTYMRCVLIQLFKC
jgi:hypothetical protein